MTGLPVPALAEIVFEGELYPDSEITLPEGVSILLPEAEGNLDAEGFARAVALPPELVPRPIQP